MGQLVSSFYEAGVGTTALGSHCYFVCGVVSQYALCRGCGAGIGADYDEAMMRVIAEKGHGQYFFIGERPTPSCCVVLCSADF